MANSTRKKKPAKPAKPRPDFPLFPHANGRWAKKVRGRFIYFGKWSDDLKGVAALSLWVDQKDDLLAGRTPRTNGDGLTVRELANHFLTSKKLELDIGEITFRTWQEYHRISERVVSEFGKSRLVSDLRPDDFEKLKAKIAKTFGLVALGGEVTKIKVLLNFAFKHFLIKTPIRCGPTFCRPAKRILRAERQRKGLKLFKAAELRTIIDAAPVTLRAMILLGVN